MQSGHPLSLPEGKNRCAAALASVACGALLLAAVFAVHTARAQNFSSGSTGADGALDFSNLAPGTTVEFNPDAFSPPLDPERDNVYHFTTINVPAGVTVKLSAKYLSGPVYWLATGAVQISGTLDLNGQDGHHSNTLINSGSRFPSLPGAGGFGGGFGGFGGASSQVGNGPGGGGLPDRGDHDGGPAGHASDGGCGVRPGRAYGNAFLVPLVGGSGGAGGSSGAGGGAGGGAILIASSVSITVNGLIEANGGKGGNFGFNNVRGGAGSGGSIRLVAPTLSGTGTLSALAAPHMFGGFCASHGRVRMEAFQHGLSILLPSGGQRTFPNALSVPSTPPPSVRVVSIAGVALPPNPTGSFELPDVNIDASAATTVIIEGRFVPVGTIVRLHLVSEDGADQIVDSAPLAGTLAQSSATSSVVFPRGFTRGFARAVWR
jgi:hypothetical protein